MVMTTVRKTLAATAIWRTHSDTGSTWFNSSDWCKTHLKINLTNCLHVGTASKPLKVLEWYPKHCSDDIITETKLTILLQICMMASMNYQERSCSTIMTYPIMTLSSVETHHDFQHQPLTIPPWPVQHPLLLIQSWLIQHRPLSVQ